MLLLKKSLSLILITILATILFFSGLGKTSLWDIDEPNNAECAREMMLRHDPIVPTFNWQLRTDKPALTYWCMWVAYKVFGVNEFAARLPAAIFGVATVVAVFLYANALWGWPAGVWAALVLMVTLFFNVSVRIATPDAPFIFFLNLSIFSLLLGFKTRRPIHFYTFYTAMALAVLTKGPAGIVLPLMCLAVFLLIKRDFSVISQMKLGTGILLFGLIALPWYVLVGVKTYGQFLFSKQGFLLKHNIHRFLSPMEGHHAPIFFYLIILPFTFFPWGGLLPYLAWAGHQRRVGGLLTDSEIFLWLWIVLFIGFFSLAQTKLPTYINPIYPSLACLTGLYLSEIPSWGENCLLGLNAFWGLTFFVAGGAALAHFYPKLVWIAFLGLIPFLGAALGRYFKRKNQLNRLVLSQVLSGYLFVLLAVLMVAPAIDHYKITKDFSLKIKSQLSPNAAIVAYHYFQPSLVFYTQHKVLKAFSPVSIKAIALRHPQIFVVGRKNYLKKLRRQLDGFQIIECRKGFYVKDTVCWGYWVNKNFH